MAFKFNKGVIFTADRKRTSVTSSGETIGETGTNNKVYQLHPHMILTTAGLGLGQDIAKLLVDIIGVNESITVTEALKIVEDAFHFNHNLFKTANPTVEYTDLVAIIGGYDIEKEEPYLYTLSSFDGLTLTKQEGSYCSIGPGKEILDTEVNENIEHCNDFLDVIKLFSSAIRKVDSVDVSKDTFSIASFYDEGFKTSSVYINENGEIL